jgi:hypothetical protein
MKSQDAELAKKLAPRLQALHGANGGDWAATSLDALALIRESHCLVPLSDDAASGGQAETPDVPRDDD